MTRPSNFDGNMLESALSASPELHFIFNSQQRFTYANEPLLKLWGLKLDQVIGKNFEDLNYPKQMVAYLREKLDQSLNGEIVRGETPYTNPEGKEGIYEYIFSPVFNHDHRVVAIHGTGRDVTESKLARDNEQMKMREQILENERLNFRNLFRQTPEMVCILSGPEHVFEFVNEAHVKALGFDATGMAVRKAQPESVEVHGILDNVYNTGETAFLHEIPVTLGDRLRYFNLTYSARLDNDGKINGVMILGVEITEQVHTRRETTFRAELGLELSKLGTVAEMIPAITRGLASFLGANRCWVAEIDDEKAEAVVSADFAMDLPSLAGTYDLQTFGGEMLASWRTGAVVSVDNVDTDPRTRQSGVAHKALGIHAFITMPLLRSGKLVSALNLSTSTPRNWTESELDLVRSITETLWNAIEKTRGQENILVALKTRDEFLSIASHELKTPITSLKMQLQLGQRQLLNTGQTPTVERLTRFYNLSLAQIDRLTALVENLLDVTKIEGGKLTLQMEELDLTQMTKEVLEGLKDQLEESGCKAMLDSLLPVMIKGDRFRLEQVMLNLLTNAMKYGPGLPILIKIRKEAESVIIVVKDNGMGIDKMKQHLIFERFERAIDGRNISGLGLGLYITRQIVEAHHGTISVESEPGLGSTFMIELPL